jgi:hypothetical protein
VQGTVDGCSWRRAVGTSRAALLLLAVLLALTACSFDQQIEGTSQPTLSSVGQGDVSAVAAHHLLAVPAPADRRGLIVRNRTAGAASRIPGVATPSVAHEVMRDD